MIHFPEEQEYKRRMRIKLPEPEGFNLNRLNEDMPGFIVVKPGDGGDPLLKDFQPIVLTCMPDDGILVEAHGFNFIEEELCQSDFVLSFGYPEEQ